MKFENKENKLREKETLKTFCDHFGMTFAKHPEYAHIGRITGFAEVKGVHRSIINSNDVIVSMRKIIRAQALQIDSRLPVAIIWAFDDALVYERVNNLKGIFYHGGRAVRQGSTFDQEMLVKVLIKNLIRIEKDNQ